MRGVSSEQPIPWTGDLDHACSAEWRGLELRAERVPNDPNESWWWSVADAEDGEELAHSAEFDPPIGTKSGASARAAAEWAARQAQYPEGR